MFSKTDLPAAELRAGSPTFGQWTGLHLPQDNGMALWVPLGFAMAFRRWRTIPPKRTRAGT